MLTLLNAFAVVAVTQPRSDPVPFVVRGYLPATQAHMAYLSYRRGTIYVVDSAVVSKGRFQLKGLVEEPQQAQLLLPPPGSSYQHLPDEDKATLYLEKGTILVTSTSRLAQAKTTGTPLNRENTALTTQTAPRLAQLDAFYEAQRHRTSAERADTALERRADAQKAHLLQQLNAVYGKYIRTHPANPFSLYVLADYAGLQPDYATYNALFQILTPGVRTSAHGRLVQQRLTRLQRTALGALAPDFSLPDSTGRLVKLSALRGQYVLVDFWASWCTPCRAENPNIARAYAAYHTKQFTVVSISLDKQSARADWLTAIHDDGLSWPQVSDLQGFKAEVAQQYAVEAIPQNVLLDPQGRIVAKNLRRTALWQKLAQLLGPANGSRTGNN
jgi:peroxiredoxin